VCIWGGGEGLGEFEFSLADLKVIYTVSTFGKKNIYLKFIYLETFKWHFQKARNCKINKKRNISEKKFSYSFTCALSL
jgi:hypothetical protein